MRTVINSTGTLSKRLQSSEQLAHQYCNIACKRTSGWAIVHLFNNLSQNRRRHNPHFAQPQRVIVLVTVDSKLSLRLAKFGNSFRSSKVHFRVRKPVCRLSIDWLCQIQRPTSAFVFSKRLANSETNF